MASSKVAQTEIIRGYRLVEPLAPQGPGELWKCVAPGGRLKVARFIPLAVADRQTFKMLLAIQHSGLIGIDRIETTDAELVLFRDLVDRTLNDVLVEYQAEGRPGLPRAETLAYLRDAAEALDAIASKYGMQHLAVTPRSLGLQLRRVKVLDYGLAQCLAQMPGGPSEARRLRAFALPHAAPELAQGSVTLACDQYSLAVSYCELLTGEAPVNGTASLAQLPEEDQPHVARALSANPAERFGSCVEFVHTLLRYDRTPVGTARAIRRPEPRPPETPPVAAGKSRPAVARRRQSASQGAPVAVESAGARPRSSARIPRPSRRVPIVSASNAEAMIPGYRLLSCGERNPTGELWKAQNQHGEPRLVRLLFGIDQQDARRGEAALERLRATRHELLAPVEFFEWPNRLAVVYDAGTQSLAGRARRCRESGMTGLPRDELLACLRDVAETLDAMAAAENLQHLSLTPRQIYLNGGKPRIVDFGLAQLFWLPAGQQSTALPPRYSAPELLQGNLTRAADQYSLASIFAELLSGQHPFRHLNRSELLAARRERPDVSLLPTADRAAVLRALDPDPARRFTCCMDLITALGGRATAAASPSKHSPEASPPVPPGASRIVPGRLTPAQVVGELVLAVAGAIELREFHGIRFVHRPGQAIEHHCFARFLPGTAWLRLEGFRQQWQAQGTAFSPDHYQLIVPLRASLWDRVLGRQQGLRVDIRLNRPPVANSMFTEVMVTIQPVEPGCGHAARQLESTGPAILESLRNFLQVHRERRGQERLPFDSAVQLCPLLPNLQRGEPISSKARDLSLHGIGLTVPQHPRSVEVAVRLAPQPGAELVSVPGRIVRAVPDGAGQFDIGVCFSNPIGTLPKQMRSSDQPT